MRLLLLPPLAIAIGACDPVVEPPTREMDSRVIIDERGVVPALVCPGAVGCATAAGPVRAGAAARTITPVVEEGGAPVWMAGFDIGRQATGVHDDVWARAMVVEQGELRVGFVVLDAVGVFHHDVVRVRRHAAAAGLALDDVIVTSTHVHETKDTMGMWGEAVGLTGYDEAYMELIAAQATEALAESVAELTPVTMTVGLTDATPYVRDSRLPEVIDQSLHVVHLARVDNAAPVSTLVVWGNHPEALGGDNTLITSDYPHYVRDEIEARLPGTTAIFASGILGGLTTTIGVLVCPDDNDVETCPQGTFERAETIGRFVGAAAVEALDAPDARDESLDAAAAISVRRHPLMFTPTNKPLAIAFQLGMMSRPVFDVNTGELIPEEQLPGLSVDDIALGLVQIDSEVSALSIGGVDIVSIPGELYGELWLAKEDGTPLIERPDGADHPDAPFETPVSTLVARPGLLTKIVLNNANDAVGYIIPEAQFDMVAPYAYDPDSGQYGEQNSLGHHAGPEVVDAIAALYALTPR
jgi:hypothetical protein